MGTRQSYGPGTFCWVNLSSTDPDSAKRFYADVLGWEYEDEPSNGVGFSMARRYGANVAAIYEREDQERAQGLPPHWNNYVTVDDADATAVRAQELGGEVVDEPFDVADAGRTAALLDPAGAMFWVWQPGTHVGAGHVNDTGCLTFNELTTGEPQRAIRFYSALLDWTFEPVGDDGGPAYWVIGNDSAAMGLNGGMRALSGEEARSGRPPAWIPYFAVESVASAAETAVAAGGATTYGPMQAGAGTIAVISDPTGASFGVFEGELDD